MWVWSKLSASKWYDAWEERFRGNPNTIISILKGGKSIRVEVYIESEEDAKIVQNHFGGSIREVKNQNWEQVAEQPARPPIKIRDQLVVVISDKEEEIEASHQTYPDREIIQIPAEMAFGIGDHATTSTCLRLLTDEAKRLNKVQPNWSMADLGTGSGLLAIAAAKLGSSDLWGCDYDAHAIKVAIKNAQRNGTENIQFDEVDVLDWTPPRQWDLVCANLFSTILQQAFTTIEKCISSEGKLIISGILNNQWEETYTKAQQAGLKLKTKVQKGKWTTALLSKASTI